MKKLAESHLEQVHKKHGFNKVRDYWVHDDENRKSRHHLQNLSKGGVTLATTALGALPGTFVKGKASVPAMAGGALLGALAGGAIYRRAKAHHENMIRRRTALMHDIRKHQNIDVWSRGKL